MSKFFANLSIFLTASFFAAVAEFSCNNYAGGQFSENFCKTSACEQYCATHNLSAYCMDKNYVQPGFCVQVGGAPSPECSAATKGKSIEYDLWCQTTGCEWSQAQCSNGCANLGAQIQSDFPDTCVSLTAGGNESTCPPMPPSASPPPSVTSSSTTPAPATSTTTTSTTSATTSTTSTTTTTATTTKTTSTTTTIKGSAAEEACWTYSSSGSPPGCFECPGTVAWNQCTVTYYSPCYTSEAECKKSIPAGGAGGGQPLCDEKCDTVDTSKLTRPAFKGPNCYDSKYGSAFGPSWKPSGKTRFEQLLPDPTALLHFVTFTSEPVPMQSAYWKVKYGCEAAAVIWENFVCAIELLQSSGKQFDSPVDKTIDKFLNSGNEEIDKLELAAFFGNKMKETGRLATFEEQNFVPGAYCASSEEWPCSPDTNYRGRGPVQVSWNYNYGALSQWWYGDKMTLITNPDAVDPEGPMGILASLWFWMSKRDFTSGSPISGSIATHDAVVHWQDGKLNSMYNDDKDYDSYSGLGLATNIINGGLECAGSTFTDGHAWRVAYFLTLARKLGITMFDKVSDPAACMADRRCAGLFLGCGNNSRGKCEGFDSVCENEKAFASSAKNGCTKAA